jgi:hypothetical protein
MAGYDKQVYKKQAENTAAAFTDTGMYILVVKRKFQNRYDKFLVLSHFLVRVSYDGVHFSSILWCVFSLSLSPPYVLYIPPNAIFTSLRGYTDDVKKSCSLLHGLNFSLGLFLLGPYVFLF